MIRIGGHVSYAGGLVEAYNRAIALKMDCFQIHATSPRQWKVSLPKDDDLKQYLELQKKKLLPAYIHAPYLINLASGDEILRFKSIENLIGNLKIGEMIKSSGVIYHLGSAVGIERQEGINNQINALKDVIKRCAGQCPIILENSAGGGDKIGNKIEEIGEILNKVKSNRLKVCIDSAHTFESGEIIKYTEENIKKFMDQIEEFIGLKNVPVWHINDSKTPAFSNSDRHENLGEGLIGATGLKNLAMFHSTSLPLILKGRSLSASGGKRGFVDWILEVPGYDGEGPDAKNMQFARNLFK